MKHFLVLALTASVASCFGQSPTTWTSVGPGGGGALFAPSWSPFNGNELTLACDMSAQYHSLDLGKSWAVTPFSKLQSGRTAQKVQYTEDPLRVYNIDTKGDLLTPVKSIDGGLTWTHLGNDPTSGGAYSLWADPKDHNRLIVTDYGHMWFSSNGGTSWSLRGTDSSGAGFPVAGVWWDGTTIVVATNLGLDVSTNGGTSFAYASTSGIPTTQAIVSFAAGKSAAGITQFYAVTLGSGDVYAGVLGDDHWNYQSVYVMRFGSGQWVSKVNGIAAGDHPFYVSMARNQTPTAFLGGGSQGGIPTVYKTTNSGGVWTSVFQATHNQNVTTGWSGDGGDRGWGYGELIFGFDVAPNSSKKIAFTDFGFCHISTDGGVSWKQTYVKTATENPAGSNTPQGSAYKTSGLENTSAFSVCWSSKQKVFAGYADIRGVRSETAGSTWSFDYTGFTTNTAYQVVKAKNARLYMASSGTHDMYESTHLTDASMDSGTGNVLFSTDQGQSWNKLGTLNRVVVAVATDPKNVNRLYAAVAHSSQGGIYVCSNIAAGTAATWTKLAVPTRTEGHADNIWVLNDGSLVCTYSGRRTSNFTDSSGVFVSTDGGAHWTDRSAANMHYWTRDLTVDPTDATQNTWYVGVYSGWGGAANGKGGLYKTTDRGVTWKKILNSDRVSGGWVDPLHPNNVFAATEVEGLWFSSNATAVTPTFTLQTTYPFRHPLRVFFNPYKVGEVWVTSFGNGIYIGQMQGP